MLRAIAPTLSFNGVDTDKVKLLGTGLWDDPAISQGTGAGRRLVRRARAQCRRAFHRQISRRPSAAAPPQLASLAYDAVSLVALLRTGPPYHRFTPAGADGPQRLCRRRRHLPLQCRRHVGARPGGAGSPARTASDVVSPAPTTFQAARAPRFSQLRAITRLSTQPARAAWRAARSPSNASKPCRRPAPRSLAASGAVPQRASISGQIEAFGQAQIHQQMLARRFVRRRPRVISTKPWPSCATASRQRSGSRSAAVAMRLPSRSSRPCAPGPTPA